MTTHRLSPLVRWSLIPCVVLLILKVITELIAYPAVVTTAGVQAPIYLILFVLALLVYSWLALFHTRAATQAQFIALQAGTFWGLLCGAAWVIELLVANVVSLQLGWLHLILYYGSVWAGFLLPGLAGLLAAWRSRRIMAGLQAGLLCGMFGGLVIFLASLVLSPLFLHAGQYDLQTIHEFARSGLPDITTYLVGDYLAAMIAHLWIGLATGFFLGMPGGTVGKALARPARVALEEGLLTLKQEGPMRALQMKSVHLPRHRRTTTILLWSMTILLVALFLVEGGGKLLLDAGTVRFNGDPHADRHYRVDAPEAFCVVVNDRGTLRS